RVRGRHADRRAAIPRRPRGRDVLCRGGDGPAAVEPLYAGRPATVRHRSDRADSGARAREEPEPSRRDPSLHPRRRGQHAAVAPGMIKASPEVQTAPVAPIVALVRCGRWDGGLRVPAPPSEWPYTTGVWHYARGIAFNAKGEAANARRELGELEKILAAVPAERTVAFFFRAKNVLQLAANVLGGEIAAKAGDTASAERLLRAAVAEQDTHWFAEPPPWYFPVRQSLGAILLQSGKAADAEPVYREDLRRNP